jgi:hypothetical protein
VKNGAEKKSDLLLFESMIFPISSSSRAIACPLEPQKGEKHETQGSFSDYGHRKTNKNNP